MPPSSFAPDDPAADERVGLAATLGLSADYSEAELRDTYRRLARTHHPDRGGDADFMMTINSAYERLLQLPMATEVDDFLGEPEDGWTWVDEPAAEMVGAFDRARTVVSFVILPAAALALLAVAVWFIVTIS